MENTTTTKAPDFLVIGAGKSGTSSLYNYLNQHPSIFTVNETNFFAYEGSQKSSGITQWEDYLNLFPDKLESQRHGEISPMYLFEPKAIRNIKRHIPDVKLIAILRHPADRLYSRYMQLVRMGKEPSDNLEDALNKGSIWWERSDLIPEGFYYTNLKHFYDEFDSENIRIYLYDDYQQNPQSIYSDLCDFIDVDSTFLPDFKIRINQSGKIKNPIIDNLIGESSVTKKFLKSKIPGVFKLLRSKPIAVRWLNQLRRLNLDKAEMPDNIRRRLTEEVYNDEIIALQDLIRTDLSLWLNEYK